MNLDEYRQWLILQTDTPKTQKDYFKEVSFFLKYSNGEFNQELLNKFFVSRLEEGKSKNTFNKNINSLRNYARFLKLNLEFPKYKTPDKRKKEFITYETMIEMKKNFVYIFDNYKKLELLFQFMFFTGLRAEEISELTNESFEWEQERLLVKNTKGKVDRYIPFMNKELFNEIKPIINEKGFDVSIELIVYYFKRIKEELNIKSKFHPHLMRVSFAKWSYKRGALSASIQSWLGHKNSSTTMSYIDVDEEDHIKEWNKIKI